jgi:hypothetical protein
LAEDGLRLGFGVEEEEFQRRGAHVNTLKIGSRVGVKCSWGNFRVYAVLRRECGWGFGGRVVWGRGYVVAVRRGDLFVFGCQLGGGIWESLGVGFVGDSSGYLISK